MHALQQQRAYSLASRSPIARQGYVALGFLFALVISAVAQRPLGIDVSTYQGTSVNWTSVKNSGVSFAWCKATEGATSDDNTFTVNISNAKTAGVLIGAYHYARPDLHTGNAGADQEASHFWSVAGPYIKNGGTYLMPMLDIEADLTGAGYTKTTLSQWVNRWCQDIVNYAAAAGVTVKPVVYTYVSYSSSWLDSTVTVWPMWMANYNGQSAQTGAPSGTAPWSAWSLWQYSSTGSVPGVTGNCDQDVFNGTLAGFKAIYVINGTPSINSQPSSRYADRGSSLSMKVFASSATTMKYQWRFNGANIAAATASSLTLTNIQATNAGNYTVVITNSVGSVTSSIAALTVNGLFTPAFSDNFDTNSAASWTLTRSSADSRAIFAYDYSGIGVPSAPNSGGTMKGLRMEANLSAGTTNALNVSPIGKSFGGNYRLHFDMWINANGPFPDGGAGSTQLITTGLGTAGSSVHWTGNGTTADGVWFAVDGEGGAVDGSTTQGDYLAYIGTTQQAIASGAYLAGTDSTSRSDGDSYYQNVFPGGQTAPASQQSTYAQQTGVLDPGTVGFAWRDVVVNKNGSTVEWFIDGLKIASVSGSSITASNIFVGYWDPYPSVTDNTNLSFGLIDNIRVEVPVVAPAISGQPSAISVVQGSNATFNVTASGTPAPIYQWRIDGTNISGATTSSFTKTNVQPTDAGAYSVVVTNVGGTVTSSSVTLTVLIPPTLSELTNQTVNAGGNASFAISAAGTAPFSYQWRFNNANILNAHSSSYPLTNVQPAAGGFYSVVVSNAAGLTISSNASLTVVQVEVTPSSVTVTNGQLQFNIAGAPGKTYLLEGSSNLVEWFSITNLPNSNGTIQFFESLGTNAPARFYRVSTSP